MARAITQDMYERAIEFYRQRPGQLTACAGHLGINYRTAHRLWHMNSRLWPDQIAIKTVLADEKARAVEKKERQQEVQQLALKDAAAKAAKLEEEASLFEEQAVKVARADVINGLAALARVSQGINVMLTRVGKVLETSTDIAPGAAFAMTRSFVHSVRAMTDAANTLVGLDRARRELPHAKERLALETMTLEEATQEVESAQRALDRAKRLGLVVVEGGAARDLDGGGDGGMHEEDD